MMHSAMICDGLTSTLATGFKNTPSKCSSLSSETKLDTDLNGGSCREDRHIKKYIVCSPTFPPAVLTLFLHYTARIHTAFPMSYNNFKSINSSACYIFMGSTIVCFSVIVSSLDY